MSQDIVLTLDKKWSKCKLSRAVLGHKYIYIYIYIHYFTELERYKNTLENIPEIVEKDQILSIYFSLCKPISKLIKEWKAFSSYK